MERVRRCLFKEFMRYTNGNFNPQDGRVAPRSGLACKNFIDTGAGVIDADYRGEVKVLLFNFSDVDFTGTCRTRGPPSIAVQFLSGHRSCANMQRNNSQAGRQDCTACAREGGSFSRQNDPIRYGLYSDTQFTDLHSGSPGRRRT